MKCPLCQAEMRITQSREDDEKVEQDFTCMNKECANYNTVVKTQVTEKNP